jgi:hypothetical protein
VTNAIGHWMCQSVQQAQKGSPGTGACPKFQPWTQPGGVDRSFPDMTKPKARENLARIRLVSSAPWVIWVARLFVMYHIRSRE